MNKELRHVFYTIFISAFLLAVNIILTINGFYKPFDML